MATTSPDGQVRVQLDIARALEQIGDEAAMRGMLPMLQELLERDVPEITQLLANHDVRRANPLLHSLKGCLPIFCAPALCEHMAQVEQMSKAGEGAEVGEAFGLLLPKLQGLQKEVAQSQYLAQA
jgi:HPt (histidine-containing phosphotransfer) domain-containing protein